MKLFSAPDIEKRKGEEILNEVKGIVPFYVPEWDLTEDKGSGPALVRIFSMMMDNIIQRLNRVPDKNFIAFLSMLGIKLNPPQPARVPVTFLLSEGAKENVVIPGRTKTAADDIIFETEKAFVATPAKLSKAYCVDFAKDAIYEVPSNIIAGVASKEDITGTRLFQRAEGDNKQKHILYLGHKDLFNIKNSGTEIIFSGLNTLVNNTSWEFFREDKDKDKNKNIDGLKITSPSNTDKISLIINEEIKEHEEYKINSRWIGVICRDISQLSNKEVPNITVEVKKEGLAPDMLFYNDVPLDIDKFPIYPFGKVPRLFDTFYIAHNDAFSKKNAKITLLINTEPSAKTTGTNSKCSPILSWEFWNGKGWKAIKGVEDTTHKLRGGPVKFSCPNDIEPAVINGHKNYWIRVRIVGGDYGKEIVIVDNGVQQGTVTPPEIDKLLIGYYYEKSQSLEHIITYNNLDYKNITEEGKVSAKPFKLFIPFIPLEVKHKALYLGLDNKLEKGPISIFFDIEEVDNRKEWVRIEWQYCCDTKGKTWKRLEVLDGTDAFAKSGTIEFVFPDNFSRCRRFGEELYWIRAAVDTEDGLKINNPPVKGIYINTAWTVQAETIKDELLGSSNGDAKQTFSFSRFPVISSDVWVNEITGLSDGERKKITEEKTINSIENKDEKGNTSEFWIQWTAVDDLLSSSKNDRHYEADKSSGVIRFGDGKHGRIPPAGNNNIKAEYRTGGGTKGNVDSSAINTLKTSVAFVDKVFNPIPSGGGADIEIIEDALDRGSHYIRNRRRAVTEEDYEYLTKEASNGIARVKCISNTNTDREFEPGCVSIIIMPSNKEEKPVPSIQLISVVEDFLRKNSAGTASISVSGPVYLRVIVRAKLVVVSMDKIPLIEKESVVRIKNFLHPLTGGYEGKGWEFGRVPYYSDFYSILEKIAGVDFVRSLEITVLLEEEKGAWILSPEGIEEEKIFPYHSVYSGIHTITATV